LCEQRKRTQEEVRNLIMMILICQTVLYLLLRWFGVGMAWHWILGPRGVETPRSWWETRLRVGGLSLVIGFLLTTLSALALAQTGRFIPAVDAWCTVLLAVIGALAGLLRARRHLADTLKHAAPLAAFLGIVMAILLAWPQRGEWIAGGWDPGVYQNQAVQLAETGTFHPDPDPLYAALPDATFERFTRRFGTYYEVFPGIPVDRETRAHSPYFFRLTPTVGAILYRAGGLRALFRINYLIGVMGLTLFAVFLLEAGAPWRLVVSAAWLLCASPLWLYHLHVPTTEMLQFMLVAAIGLLLAVRGVLWIRCAVLGLLMVAAVLNRHAFVPFAGFLALVAAWSRRDGPVRALLVEQIALATGVLAGVWLNRSFCGITFVRLGASLERILVTVWIGGVTTGLLGVGLGHFRKLRPALDTVVRWGACMALGLVCVAGLTSFLNYSPFSFAGNTAVAVLHRLDVLLPFMGYASVLAACLGAAVVLAGYSRLPLLPRCWSAFLLLGTAVLLVQPNIREIMPWMSRRFLAYALPTIALLAAAGLDALARLGWRACIAAAIVAVLLPATNLKRVWHAWDRTEYDGLSGLLDACDRQLNPRDVIVVDAPKWGTPLALVHGRSVLNGRHLWRDKKTETVEKGLDSLRELHAQGWRIRFLTTTPDQALSIYAASIQPVTLDWDSGDFKLGEIIHHRRAPDFVIREYNVRFRLYTWNLLRE